MKSHLQPNYRYGRYFKICGSTFTIHRLNCLLCLTKYEMVIQLLRLHADYLNQYNFSNIDQSKLNLRSLAKIYGIFIQ